MKRGFKMALQSQTVKQYKLQFNIVNFLRIILIAGLAILIFYPPYARGLFFDKELLPFHIISFSLFILFWIYKLLNKDYAVFKTPLDYAAAGMVVVYLLPIAFTQAANVRTALGELLKYCNYFAVYLMIRDTVKSKKALYILLNIVLASAVGLALIGIDAAAGEKAARIIEKVVNILPGVEYKIFGAYVGGRINSMLQYPNTLASYLLAAFILSTGLTIYHKNGVWKHLYTGASFVLLLTFIFTYSRGAWLMLPLVYILFILLLWNVYHAMEGILYGGAAGVLALAATPLFYKYLQLQDIRAIWKITVIGAILAIIVSFVLGFLIGFFKRLQKKHLLLAGGTLAGVILVAAGILVGIALNIEKPVILSHTQNEKNSNKVVSKVIDGIQSSTPYTFKYDVEFNSTDEKKWAYKLIIDSLNSENKVENITEATSIELQNNNQINFTTLEDTEKISIKIVNTYTGTSVKLQNGRLMNNSNNKENKVIFRYKYIPDTIVNRFNAINTDTHSVAARFAFYKDALKIIKDHPIIGAGGGAWAALYFMYQSYMYWSTQTHNYFMQVWIEAGTLGLLMLLTFIALLILSIYQYRKQHKGLEKENILIAALLAAILSLLGHSIIDFDLSLAAVSLLVWELIAFASIIANNLFETKQYTLKRYKYEIGGAALAAVVIFVSVISLQSGYVNAQAAITETKKNNVKTAVDYFEKAVKRDPFTASYKMDLAKLYHEISVKEKNGQKQIVNKEQFEKAETLVEKALKLEPYNAQLYAHAAAFMMNRGKLQEGLRYIDKSIEVQPLRPENYQQKADVYFQIGVSNLNAKKYDEAEKALKEVLNIPVAVKELNKKILKPISLTTETIKYIEKSDFLMKNYRDPNSVGKFNNLVFHSYISADADNDGLPDGWVRMNGKESQIELEITPENSIKMLNYGKKEGFLRTRFFSLKPAKKYVLEVKLKGQLEKNNNFDIYVLSNTGKSIQFHTNSIKLEDSFKEYSFDFTTTEDIISGKQYIRFDHNGNDDGNIEIAEVNLYSVK